MEFKILLKRLRKHIGLNQTQFGNIIGKDQKDVSELERGKRGPTKTLVKYLEYRYGNMAKWGIEGDDGQHVVAKRHEAFGSDSIEAETVPPGGVAEGVAGYEQTPEDDLLTMTKEVLRSGTSHAVSLTTNIQSLYEAVQTKKTLEARVENERRLVDLEKRLTALERDRKKPLKGEPPNPSFAEGSGSGTAT